MKKTALIVSTVLLAASVMAYSTYKGKSVSTNQVVAKCNPTKVINDVLVKPIKPLAPDDFAYNVDVRFNAKVTKTQLQSAITIKDILPTQATKGITHFYNAEVAIVQKADGSFDKAAQGQNEVLNEQQLALIQSLDYSTDFYIHSDYQIKNRLTGALQDEYLTYFLSVIPEQQAAYAIGKEQLINYLKDNSTEERQNLDRNVLKPGIISFTITKEGSIADINVSNTSGYDHIDEKMLTLVKNIPGQWVSARNAQGIVVDQELIFSFGLIGC